MSVKRNHHLIPRSYLKGFAIPSKLSHTFVYSRGLSFAPRGARTGRNPSCRPLRQAGATRDAYAFTEADGTVNYEQVENELEQIERRGDPILKKIRNEETISTAEKHRFAEYVGFMIKRVRARDLATKTQVDQLVDSQDWEDLQRRLQLVGNFSAARHIANRDEWLPRMKDSVQKTSITKGLPTVLKALRNMRWRFLRAPEGSCFVTSDNPVVFDRSLGLGKFASVLTFPLSSEVTLQVDWRIGEDLTHYDQTAQDVASLNRSVFLAASEIAYAPICEGWVCDGLNLWSPVN